MNRHDHGASALRLTSLSALSVALLLTALFFAGSSLGSSAKAAGACDLRYPNPEAGCGLVIGGPINPIDLGTLRLCVGDDNCEPNLDDAVRKANAEKRRKIEIPGDVKAGPARMRLTMRNARGDAEVFTRAIQIPKVWPVGR